MKLFSGTENASFFENCVTFEKDKHCTKSIALCTRESTETLPPKSDSTSSIPNILNSIGYCSGSTSVSFTRNYATSQHSSPP